MVPLVTAGFKPATLLKNSAKDLYILQKAKEYNKILNNISDRWSEDVDVVFGMDTHKTLVR